MTRLVLHVGLAKTGTSAFQSFATWNRGELAARGVAYCDGFRGRNHSELAIAFSHRITPLTRSYGVHDESTRQALRARIPVMLGDPHRARTVLASTEHLTNLVYRPESIAELATAMRAIFDSVVIAIVLRRPDYWSPSMYAESVKAGGARRFHQGFVSRHRRLLDHLALLQRWAAAFGRDNVVAVPFLERDKSDPNAIPLRLLELTGMDVDGGHKWPAPPLVQNRSLSAYGVELLRRVNAQDPNAPMRDLSQRRRMVGIVRREWPGEPQALTPTAAKRLAEYGWVRADVGSVASACQPLWREWCAQPDAETMAPPSVADEDLRRLIALAHGKPVRHRWAAWIPARARRATRQLIRRS